MTYEEYLKKLKARRVVKERLSKLFIKRNRTTNLYDPERFKGHTRIGEEETVSLNYKVIIGFAILIVLAIVTGLYIINYLLSQVSTLYQTTFIH